MLAVSKAAGIESPCVPRIASGFGGGIGRQGETCGAITGGVMALGLIYGRDITEDADAKNAVYAKTAMYMQRFSAHHNTVLCRDITGIDMSTDEGVQSFVGQNMHEKKCNGVVTNAVVTLLEIMNQHE